MALFPVYSNSFGGVLVASADSGLRDQIVSSLNSNPFPVLAAHGGADALGKLESSECDVLLLDRRLPDLDADELMSIISQRFPGVEVLEIDPKSGNLRGKASHPTPGVMRVFRALESLVEQQPKDEETAGDESERKEVAVEPLPGMIGNAELMREIAHMVRSVARWNTTVLVLGETGTGKELVARAIHQLSLRAEKPFVVINCAAIPDTLLEAELFGYTKGSFTGAVQSYAGRIQAAQGGTLFLDEIGELPLALQSKLLRFLERGEIQRIGSAETIQTDVRVVAATNVQILERVAEGEFREDLYYRLAVFPIELPPLSQRKEDVAVLASHFLATTEPDQTPELSRAALALLENHAWPGNVRELKHVMERALILSNGQPMIGEEHIRFAPMVATRQAARKPPVSL